MERTIRDRFRIDEGFGDRHIVLIHRGEEFQPFGVESGEQQFRKIPDVIARIVAFADEPVIPDQRIGEQILARELHVGAQPVDHLFKPRLTGAVGAESGIDGGVLVVDADGAGPAVNRRGRGDGGGGKFSLHSIDADLTRGGGRVLAGAHENQRHVGAAGEVEHA